MEQLLPVHPMGDLNPWFQVFNNGKGKENIHTCLRPRQGLDLEPQELLSGNKRMSWRQTKVGKEIRRILGMERDQEHTDKQIRLVLIPLLMPWNGIEGFGLEFIQNHGENPHFKQLLG